MLQNYLRGAVSDLETLIELTQLDICDIKEANHERIFERNLQKQPLIVSFENKKNMAQQEIVSLKSANPQVELGDLLDEESSELLGSMKQKLQKLKEVNSGYARMVLAVSEFYNSLMQKIIPHEVSGYGVPKTTQSTFLKIEA